MCVDEVRSIPGGGGGAGAGGAEGGGGGPCEEASFEEYHGLRQTRKGHEEL